MNKLKGQKIVSCRICKGDHWTTRCPYKDTLGPMQKELAEQLGLSTGEKEKLPGGGNPKLRFFLGIFPKELAEQLGLHGGEGEAPWRWEPKIPTFFGNFFWFFSGFFPIFLWLFLYGYLVLLLWWPRAGEAPGALHGETPWRWEPKIPLFWGKFGFFGGNFGFLEEILGFFPWLPGPVVVVAPCRRSTWGSPRGRRRNSLEVGTQNSIFFWGEFLEFFLSFFPFFCYFLTVIFVYFLFLYGLKVAVVAPVSPWW
uniref:Eukaryotic translation initiation factor 3 subunit G N-terminal domain-containing protein n=1 Tax=Cyanoderma ruficeps TaxID=181631 RepID=A0A8C3QG52_9PASS